jgi:tetratricopeptide (TPR) repeat protein
MMKSRSFRILATSCLSLSLSAASLFAQLGGIGNRVQGNVEKAVQPVPRAVQGVPNAAGAVQHQRPVAVPQQPAARVLQGAGVQPNRGPVNGAVNPPHNGQSAITDRVPGIRPQVGAPPRVNLPQTPVNPRPNGNGNPVVPKTVVPNNVAPNNPVPNRVLPNNVVPKTAIPNNPLNHSVSKPPLNGANSLAPRTGTSLPDRAVNGVANRRQVLGGNQINLGNRQINLAAQTYRPAYQWHPRYAGYWGGNYGWGGYGPGGYAGYGPGGYGNGWGYGYGGYGFGYRPLGWGLGAWGLGALAYNSGYLGYYNPYYSGGANYGGYNYSQPLPVVYTDSTTPAAGSNGSSPDAILDSAAGAFQQGDYDRALDLVNKGIAQYPSDSVLHEFRGLILFAKGDYQQAASTIHSVLAVGPGWNWQTLRSFYPDVATYTTQLRSLEAFTQQNTKDAPSRFLLAYHYLVGGHNDAAARKLNEVVAIEPRDQVAADVLKMITAPAPSQAADQAATPAPQQVDPANTRPAPGPAVDPTALVGTWSAARDDGAQFKLTLNKDGSFVWNFTQKEGTQEFKGKYTLEGNVLALQRSEGGSLVATVTPDGKNFNFKLLGAPPQDPGLNFHQ